jgi:hypothetical protein
LLPESGPQFMASLGEVRLVLDGRPQILDGLFQLVLLFEEGKTQEQELVWRPGREENRRHSAAFLLHNVFQTWPLGPRSHFKREPLMGKPGSAGVHNQRPSKR